MKRRFEHRVQSAAHARANEPPSAFSVFRAAARAARRQKQKTRPFFVGPNDEPTPTNRFYLIISERRKTADTNELLSPRHRQVAIVDQKDDANSAIDDEFQS